jgi:hypothetical protein
VTNRASVRQFEMAAGKRRLVKRKKKPDLEAGLFLKSLLTDLAERTGLTAHVAKYLILLTFSECRCCTSVT